MLYCFEIFMNPRSKKGIKLSQEFGKTIICYGDERAGSILTTAMQVNTNE